jgi:DNA invertase Pin-like site-specific DNA recombinase
MRAIIYLRVSTLEQGVSGLGLEAQEAAASDYCARQGFEVVEVVREVQSGKSTKKRPLLIAALERCRKGEAEILIASNVSRLSRSIGDLADMLEEAGKRGYGIAALDTGLDTTTPAGKMVFQILGVAAEYERAIIADRTKKALAAKKARGERVGRVSTLDLETVHLIQTYRAQGLSFALIARELNAQGVATGQKEGAAWYGSTVRKVLLANGGEVLAVMPRPGRKTA